MAVDPKYIKTIQGREFVTFEGLLDQAHRDGLSLLETELLQAPSDTNGGIAIVHARVQTKKGSFTGLGDASRENCRENIAVHLVRMAETRSIARALRFSGGVGQTALEELGDPDTPDADQPTDAQIDKIDELSQHEAISEADRGKVADALPTLTRTQADDLVAILEAKIQAVEDAGKKKARKSTRTKSKSQDAAAGNGTPKSKDDESASPTEDHKPDDPGTPANGQAQEPEDEENAGPPATPKQIGLIERTVRESADVLTAKEIGHIQALLSAKVSRSKASEILDFLLGRSVKNPLTGAWERVSQGIVEQRRATEKAA